MASWDFIQKQVLLGSAATGKSSLLVRLTDGRFLIESEPTIGVEFGSRLVKLGSPSGDGDEDNTTKDPDEGKVVKLQIWDTAGQESFRSITRSYYRGAFGALLVFSLTSLQSFHDVQSIWLKDLQEFGEEDIVILLVGNKLDECEESENGASRREVEGEEARTWAEENGLGGYVETSAKSGEGVEEAFNTLTRTVHARQRALLKLKTGNKSSGGSSFPLNLGASAGKVGGCC